MKRRSSLLLVAALAATLVVCNARPVLADTVLAPGGNFSDVAGYTYIKVVNLGTKSETVTVSFVNDQGAVVGSTSAPVAPGAAWSVGTNDGPPLTRPAPTTGVSTGDFDGYVCVSSTGSDKKILVTGMIEFPIDGAAAIGNALVANVVPMVAAKANSCGS